METAQNVNTNIFKKATKSKSKLRLAIFGISGSGKTYTALEIAKGMGGKIAVLDTEHGSASKYADRFEFDVAEMEKPFSIEKYIKFIKNAEQVGYNILIIDSLSHAWQELLEMIDKLSETKYKGNNWRAWSEGTPIQRNFIDTLLSYNGHILATMRSKTEYAVTNDNGKTNIKRIGTAAEQGKNIEYEFDMLIEMTEEHHCRVLKDRTGKFQDKIITKPDKSFGEQLIAWLNEGVEKLEKSKNLADEIMKEEAGKQKKLEDATEKPELKKEKVDQLTQYNKFYNSLSDEIKFSVKDMTDKQRFDLFNKCKWSIPELDVELTKIEGAV